MTQVRLNFFIALMLISFNKLFAQDIIYKQDGSKIEAKVLEISPTEIKYKLFKNQDGPAYLITKNDVMMIVYQNGENEIFTNKGQTKRKSGFNDSLLKDFGKSFISMNLFDLFYTNLAFSYEYFSKSGYVGFKIPVSFGLNGSNDVDYYDFYNGYYNNTYYNNNTYFNFNGNKIVSSGIDINFYPFGQRKASYLIGPSFEFGTFYYKTYNYSNPYYSPYSDMLYKGKHLAFLVNNGLLYQPTKNFNFSLTFGIGFKKDETHFAGEPIQFKASGGINMGYRF